MSGEPVRPPTGTARSPFFYGWVMLPVVMVVQMATMPGQTFGVAIFIPHLLEAFSLSQSELSGAYMLGTFLASIPMIYVGALMDRYGPRRTLAGVATLFGVACIGMSQTQGLVTVFFGFLFLRMLGQGAMTFLGANAVAMWFSRRLGFASGLMSVGEAFSFGAFPTLNLLLIEAVGWRTAYASLGVAVWMLVLPLLALAFRNRPEDIAQVVDGSPAPAQEATPGATKKGNPSRDFSMGEAIRTRPYWIVGTAGALFSMIITGLSFHAVQIYLGQGMLEAAAAAMFGTMAISFFVVRLVGGVLADRLRLHLLLSLSVAFLSAAIALLMQVSDAWTSNLFATALGTSQGLFSAVSATIWVRYFGRRHLGKIRGGLTTVMVASSSAGPFVLGAGFDLFGGFHEVLWVFLALTMPMAVVTLWATQPARLEAPSQKNR